MKLAASLALLYVAVAILSVREASAQLAPTGATLRFFEEGPGTVTPQTRRMYATRFDASRSRFIGVEVSLTHPAPGVVVDYPVSCEYIKPDGSTTGPIEIEFQVQPDWTSSIHASSWGWAEPGDWAAGTYRAVCSGGGRTLGEATFELMSTPSDVAGVDARVAAIRFFPSGPKVTPIANRQYATTFPAAQAARVGIELNFAHAPFGRAIEIPWSCYYFMPDGRTMGPMANNYAPQPDWNGGYSADAWGWDQPGQWPRGHYTAVCMIYGRPVAVERFEVN
jgi:hypothetical protein